MRNAFHRFRNPFDRLRASPAVRRHLSQLWKFGVCGGIGTTLDLIVVTILIRTYSISPYVAYVPSTIVGASFVFVVNKFFTFKSRSTRIGKQIAKFALVYGAAFGLNLLCSWTLLWFFSNYLFPKDKLYFAAMVARVIAIGIIAIWNYSLSHGFIFKEGEVDAAIV